MRQQLAWQEEADIAAEAGQIDSQINSIVNWQLGMCQKYVGSLQGKVNLMPSKQHPMA